MRFLTILIISMIITSQAFAVTPPPAPTQSLTILQDQLTIAQAQKQMQIDQNASQLAIINTRIANLQAQITAATPSQ